MSASSSPHFYARLLASALIGVSGYATAGPNDPAVPAGLDPGGIAVAHIDTGVNYTLPQIAGRLARDGEGDVIGYDFQDDDLTPYDAQPGATSATPRRHGTSVASILLTEAPGVRLQPYRYAAGRPQSFADAVYQIAYTSARIVAMPLGGYKQEEWEAFAVAAKEASKVLFIVSAGNEGKDIDVTPIYPAAFGLENVLVVASTDAFGRFAADANTGAQTVDIATPAEAVQGFDFLGGTVVLAGSSFAVPRIAALAARILATKPQLDTAGLKAAILALAGPNPGSRTKRTKHGWIAAPNEVPVE